MQEWDQRTVFMRHIDGSGGSYVEQHHCWNAQLFIKTQRDAALAAGGKVIVITPESYRHARNG